MPKVSSISSVLPFLPAINGETKKYRIASKPLNAWEFENRVKVHVGSQYPLLHDYKAYLCEEQLFGPAIDYLGAYAAPQPDPNHLVPPPDGFATHTRPAKEDAVDFIIQSIHRYPNEVSILAIAPLINIAIAVRKYPSIIPLIKQIVFLMGGQVYAPGNAYNDAGEFNWWFDPEAAQVVLRQRAFLNSSFRWTVQILSL